MGSGASSVTSVGGNISFAEYSKCCDYTFPGHDKSLALALFNKWACDGSITVENLNSIHHEFKDVALPPIRLIDFDDFKICGSFPRYPENKSLAVSLPEINRNESFVVFISHCWLRGWSGAAGWDGRPHPDNATGDKYDLCKMGIEKAFKSLAPKMKKCYIWLDFGCIDQDGSPAGELKQLDKIVECCDCIFTPIFDDDVSWEMPSIISNYFKDYQAKSWNDGPFAYLNRGWCRVEMFYAANIPLYKGNNSLNRVSKFSAGLAVHASNGRRPHLLFGSRELRQLRTPYVLPPLQNSYFEEYNPEQGNLSFPGDLDTIKRLVNELKPYMKTVHEEYTGPRNGQNQMHGEKGTYKFGNGDVYVGEFADNFMHGTGVYTYSEGGSYTGQFVKNLKHGQGVNKYASGNEYVGTFERDRMHGKGLFLYANGEKYEGMFCTDAKHVQGVFRFINGDVYEGEFKDDLCDGQGVFTYASNSTNSLNTNTLYKQYRGSFKADYKCGKGFMRYLDGDEYEGDFDADVAHGQGVYRYANGNVYTGSYAKGMKEGMGHIKFSNGEEYKGEFVADEMHGKGEYSYPEGDKYSGYFAHNVMHGAKDCKYVYASGATYVGGYSNGKKHGHGKYTYADGAVFEGEYKDGNKVEAGATATPTIKKDGNGKPNKDKNEGKLKPHTKKH